MSTYENTKDKLPVALKQIILDKTWILELKWHENIIVSAYFSRKSDTPWALAKVQHWKRDLWTYRTLYFRNRWYGLHFLLIWNIAAIGINWVILFFVTFSVGWQGGTTCILLVAILVGLLGTGLAILGHSGSDLVKRLYYFHSSGEIFFLAGIL